jgi:hypothetical protein
MIDKHDNIDEYPVISSEKYRSSHLQVNRMVFIMFNENFLTLPYFWSTYGKKEEFFTIFDKCHLSLRSFPVDFLKVDSIIIPYQVFDIRICPIRLQILHIYLSIFLNISMLITDTLCERLKVDYWTKKFYWKYCIADSCWYTFHGWVKSKQNISFRKGSEFVFEGRTIEGFEVDAEF